MHEGKVWSGGSIERGGKVKENTRTRYLPSHFRPQAGRAEAILKRERKGKGEKCVKTLK